MSQKFVMNNSHDESDRIAAAVDNAKNTEIKPIELTDEQKKGIGYGHEQQVLAMTRMLLPVISAMIANPGTASSSNERIDLISKIIDTSLSVSTAMADTICPVIAKQTWVKKQAFEFVAQYISSEWEKTGKIECEGLVDAVNSATIGVQKHALDWLENSGNITPIKNEYDAVSRIRLSTIKAVAPLMESVQDFSFWIEKLDANAKEKMIKSMVDRVNEMVADTANKFSDQNGLAGDQRIMLWQSLISRAYTISNGEYNRLKTDVTSEINNETDPASRIAIRKQCAINGISHVVDVVMKRTESSMETLFGLSNAMADMFEKSNKVSDDEKTGTQVGHATQKP
jgi:hypothetical protein